MVQLESAAMIARDERDKEVMEQEVIDLEQVLKYEKEERAARRQLAEMSNWAEGISRVVVGEPMGRSQIKEMATIQTDLVVEQLQTALTLLEWTILVAAGKDLRWIHPVESILNQQINQYRRRMSGLLREQVTIAMEFKNYWGTAERVAARAPAWERLAANRRDYVTNLKIVRERCKKLVKFRNRNAVEVCTELCNVCAATCEEHAVACYVCNKCYESCEDEGKTSCRANLEKYSRTFRQLRDWGFVPGDWTGRVQSLFIRDSAPIEAHH